MMVFILPVLLKLLLTCQKFYSVFMRFDCTCMNAVLSAADLPDDNEVGAACMYLMLCANG